VVFFIFPSDSGGIRTHPDAICRWHIAATSSKTGGYHTICLRQIGNRIPHPLFCQQQITITGQSRKPRAMPNQQPHDRFFSLEMTSPKHQTAERIPVTHVLISSSEGSDPYCFFASSSETMWGGLVPKNVSVAITCPLSRSTTSTIRQRL